MMWSKLSMNLQLGSQELVKYILLYDLSMYFFMWYTYIHVHISAYIRKCQDLVGSESQEERWIIGKHIGLKLRDLSSDLRPDTIYPCDLEQGNYLLCVYAFLSIKIEHWTVIVHFKLQHIFITIFLISAIEPFFKWNFMKEAQHLKCKYVTSTYEML